MHILMSKLEQEMENIALGNFMKVNISKSPSPKYVTFIFEEGFLCKCKKKSLINFKVLTNLTWFYYVNK